MFHRGRVSVFKASSIQMYSEKHCLEYLVSNCCMLSKGAGISPMVIRRLVGSFMPILAKSRKSWRQFNLLIDSMTMGHSASCLWRWATVPSERHRLWVGNTTSWIADSQQWPLLGFLRMMFFYFEYVLICFEESLRYWCVLHGSDKHNSRSAPGWRFQFHQRWLWPSSGRSRGTVVQCKATLYYLACVENCEDQTWHA